MTSSSPLIPFMAISLLLGCIGSSALVVWLGLRLLYRRMGWRSAGGPAWRSSLVVAAGPFASGVAGGAFLSLFMTFDDGSLGTRLQGLLIWGLACGVLALTGSQIGYRLGYAARGERGPRSGWVSLAALLATLFGLLLTLVIGLPPFLTFCGGPFVVAVLVAAIPVRQPVVEPVEEAIGVPQTVI